VREEVLVVERDVHIRRREVHAARVLLDASFRVEVRHAEPTAGELLRVRQRADDGVLYTAGHERIDEVAALIELALVMFPVVGHAERAVAAAQSGAQGEGIVQVALDQFAAETCDLFCRCRARTTGQAAHRVGSGAQELACN
jgi:hypothetical protein